MLFAKSSAGGSFEALEAHSLNVLALARSIYHRLPPAVQACEGLLQDLETAALGHDIGKAAIGFQQMLTGERPDWNSWRHEVLSAAFISKLPVSEEVIFAVLTHHRQIPGSGDLNGRLHWTANAPENWPPMVREWRVNAAEAFELWNRLCAQEGKGDLQVEPFELENVALDVAWLNHLSIRKQRKFISPNRRMRASLLRALLMSADHLASAGNADVPPPIQLKNFSPRFALRGFQRRCGIPGHVILNAPTGSGKTEAALVWAGANQPVNGKFFYTLPYTAALNAMYARLHREFPTQSGSIGLLHARAAHHLFEASQHDYPANPQKATAEAHARARLAHEAFYPVRVCTPHQLLRFSLRGKGWEQMLSEIPGSCIVFDEVHSYDARLAGLTLGTAKLFASMGAKLMFISATLPFFMRQQIEKLAPMNFISPEADDAGDREVLARKRHAALFVEGNLLGQVSQIVEAARNGLHVLIVCNHVHSAQSMSRALRNELGNDERAVCLFHGRFNMRDRKEKEQRLASEALPQVLVATQVVEVSLDLSFDVGYFEAAPIDALIQRMGRVNRQGNTPVPVFVARSAISKHRLYDSHHTEKTVGLLSAFTGPLSERDLTDICDRVYEAGYQGEEKRIFEERLNHPFLSRFEEELVAGEHNPWIEDVIENQNGRADVLPKELTTEHESLIGAKRWLEADALLVNTYTENLKKHLDKTRDPWVVNLKYDHEGLHSPAQSQP